MVLKANYWEGELIRLRAVEPGDADLHYAWNQDLEMYQRLDRIPFPQSYEATRAWATRTSTTPPADDNYHLAIETLAGELVGGISSQRCDRRNGHFEYGIAVRRAHQRQGYAREAILLLLGYFFEELRYQKATVEVFSFNTASIRLHESLGFVQEGRLRRMIFTQGQYFDALLFGLTAEEFVARHGRRQYLAPPADGAPGS